MVNHVILREIESHVLSLLRNPDIELESIIDHDNDRVINGFPGIYIAWHIVAPFAEKYGFTDREITVEIFTVTKNISEKIHYHQHSTALLTILGQAEKHHEPQNSYYVFKSLNPIPAVSGVNLTVTPGVYHGFFVLGTDRGTLSFLSVQSPKIEEDFHNLPGCSSM